MNKLLTTFILTLIVVVLSGCFQNQQDLLVGHWQCNGQEDNMKLAGKLEYVSNGTSNALMEIRMRDSGAEVVFEMMAQGSWQLTENSLVESITRITITRLNVNGQELPPNQFPQEMKDALVGTSSGSEVIQLDKHVLITKSSGTQTTCSRI